MEQDLPEQTLRVARFLGLSGVDRARAAQVAEQSGRSQMVELNRARPLTRPGFEFVRSSAEVPRDVPPFEPSLRALVLERCKEGMQCFGYPLE
jgi:hypothetical protein